MTTRLSPLDHSDTDAICIVSRTLNAECSGCGQPVYGRLHLPLIAHGFYCSQCCPCKSFVATDVERQALTANRVTAVNGPANANERTGPIVRTRQRQRLPLNGRLYIVGNPRLNKGGKRKRIWELIKDGMTIKALYRACKRRQLDGPFNLRFLIDVCHVIEIR
jgi:hypothetical protein